jgi:cytochrome bd-type quinol oxidase subunit 2
MSSEEKTSEDNGEPPKRNRHRLGSLSPPNWRDLLLNYSGLLLFLRGAQSDALDNPYAIFVAVAALVLSALTTYTTAQMARKPQSDRRRYNLAANVVNTFLVITVLFSILYWTIGTEKNFSVKLSRIDAIYFSLGTLTTAGTGTIGPTSDLSRALVSGQMVLDLVFVAVVVTTAVTRWSEKSS